MSEAKDYEGWTVLELMGHRKLGGYVRTETIAGMAFLRIDVPGAEGVEASQFYSPQAVYCLTPCTEEVARRLAAACHPQPVQRWELPALAHEPDEDDEEDSDLEIVPGNGLGEEPF